MVGKIFWSIQGIFTINFYSAHLPYVIQANNNVHNSLRTPPLLLSDQQTIFGTVRSTSPVSCHFHHCYPFEGPSVEKRDKMAEGFVKRTPEVGTHGGRVAKGFVTHVRE